MNPINPKKFYTANEVITQGLLDDVRISSLPTLIKRIEKNEIRSVKYGDSTGTRYYIKGENLIEFIAKFEDSYLRN